MKHPEKPNVEPGTASTVDRGRAARKGPNADEEERVIAEEGRLSAEDERRHAEEGRSFQEWRRLEGERLREVAETARKVAEEARNVAEAARGNAEKARQELAALDLRYQQQEQLVNEMQQTLRSLERA
jgi:hypothetical protein